MRRSITCFAIVTAALQVACSSGTTPPAAAPASTDAPAPVASPALPSQAAPPRPLADIKPPEPPKPKTPADEVSALVAQARADLQSNKTDTAIEALDNAYKIKPDHPEVLFLLGIATQNQAQIEMRMGDGPDVEEMFMKSAQYFHKLHDLTKEFAPGIRSQAAVAIYNEACVHSRRKASDKALKALEESLELGFADTKANADNLAVDADLNPIRDDPRFKELMAKYQKPKSSEPKPEAPKSPEPEKKPESPQ
jgi:tetratricopeptide (TPR) repeat protein